ncbi:MFS transporter [Brachybacterium saurashtrense]|uniref:MFS transporter n=1 Tax=Brachybacterium saurashtrense TaxID=556288 RepID=A0A345YLP4_9MICO|nr:MFS transporter [Brachybacterium saurashtrense]AXK44846.1 MFS transporter [Brachybacterium saurashtrense]RRR20745.1 MFS transporter [Brachybacterium saurashtrense]
MSRARTVQLGAIALTLVLTMSLWFSASAVLPDLRRTWDLGSWEASWLTSTVQVGFVAGAVASAFVNLADRVPPHRLMAGSAVGAAASTIAIPVLADGFIATASLRIATGCFLAGVYPVGIKLMASWFPAASRGLAVRTLIGALTVGSALPHFIGALGHPAWQQVLSIAAALGIAGAAVAGLIVRPGPHLAATARPRPQYVVEMFRQLRPRLANIGYFGHMWELLNRPGSGGGSDPTGG